ncbi:MAG: EAL domain-containing protein [Chloroflexota bacterium]|nr:EAL domain-containing protein [Chloroflexota bacterium]
MLHSSEPYSAPITLTDEAFLRLVVMQAPALLWTVDRDLRFTMTNGAGLGVLQLQPNERLGLSLAQYFGTSAAEFAPLAAHRRALAGETVNYEFNWLDRVFHCHVAPLRAADGAIMGVTGVALDLTEQRRAESVLAGQKQVLELLAEGAPLPDVLTALIRFMEAQAGEAVCAIFLRDSATPTLRLMAAPSLPAAYHRAVAQLAVGPLGGSCGLAVERGEAVIIPDMALDPLYGAWLDLATACNLRACWSSPICTTDGAVLGTFAMYYRQPRRPSAFDVQLAAVATHLARIAITRTQAEAQLRANEQQYRFLLAAAERQAQELALLDRVRTAVTEELDLALVFRTVVRAIADTFGYTQVSLYLCDGAVLALQHQVGYDQVLACIPLEHGIMGRVIRTAQPVLLTDVHSDPDFMPAIAGIASEVCVPLSDQGRVVGVLNLESTNGVRLTHADLDLMMALSAHIGNAIGRARLYTQMRESEQRYRLVVNTVQEVIFQVAPNGVWTFLNPAWTTLTGFSLATSLGTPMLDYMHPADRPRKSAVFQRMLARQENSCHLQVRYMTRGGGYCWVDLHAQTTFAPDGSLIGVSGTLMDITSRVQAEESLRRQNEELAALHDTALGLINQLDPDSLLETVLARATALLDTPHGYLYVTDAETGTLIIRSGTGVFATQVIAGYRLQRGAGLAGRVWASGQPLIVADYSTWADRQVDLDALGIRAVVGIPLWAGGEVVGVIGLAYLEAGRPITTDVLPLLTRFGQLASLALENARLYAAAQQEVAERTRAEARLAHLALHDSLTDLPNRSLLHDRLNVALHPPNPPLALLVMDLDRFKEVNDTLGHYLGDLLLREVGTRLAATMRAGDLVARLGGDEFAVLLPHTDGRIAQRIARRLLKVLEQPFALEGHLLDVRASIGIVLSPAHGRDTETLLRRGDVAMYYAKRSGSGASVYSANHDPYSADRLALIGDLRRAIEQDELVLYYQPKVSHRSRRITGVEALVRWPHPERGLLGPDQFVGLAEHTGLIKALSHWVLTTALRQCRLWWEAGLTLPVAVNLSMGDLHDPHLPDIVARLLHTVGVAPDLLRVEITEGAAMADVGRTLGVLTQLRNSGVQLAIDDFGTGHSSLGQLKRLPLDQLKIDKTFVREITLNANDATIVRSTIELGHKLGLSVIAEGIEDRATWDLLTQWGCDEGQGYYLSRPIPAAAIPLWVEQFPLPSL